MELTQLFKLYKQVAHSDTLEDYTLDVDYGYTKNKFYAFRENGSQVTFNFTPRIVAEFDDYDKFVVPSSAISGGDVCIGNRWQLNDDGTIKTDENGNAINPDDLVGIVKTDLLSSFEQAILESKKTGKEEKSSDRTYLDVLLTESIGFRNRKLSQILINSYIHPEETETESERHPYFLTAKDARYLTLFNRALLAFFGNDYQIKAGMEAQITLISKKTREEIPYQELSLGEKEVLLLILRARCVY